MIKLIYNQIDKIVYTTWRQKLSKYKKVYTTNEGIKKEYTGYFTRLPQEIYTFLGIKDNYAYLIKSELSEEVIITSKRPQKLQELEESIVYSKVKLTLRGKKGKNMKEIPSTTFTIPKKISNKFKPTQEIKYTLYPKTWDKYRNELGLITIKWDELSQE